MKLFEDLGLEDTKVSALTEAFDKAVMAKSVELMDEHVAAKIAEKEEILKEEFNEKIENLEDTLDGYMESVIEEFIKENAHTYETQIEESKTVKLLEMFDKMVKLTGIDMLTIQEAADENSLANKNRALEEKIADMQDQLIESRKEADKFLKAGLIVETKQGLTVTEVAKFEKLAEMVTFERTEKYTKALDTIKESIIDARSEDFKETEIKLPSDAFKPRQLNLKEAVDYSKYV
jgi:hypothetical protein